jgi:hypothetical protein
LNEPRPTISDIENCGANIALDSALDSALVAMKMTEAIQAAVN